MLFRSDGDRLAIWIIDAQGNVVELSPTEIGMMNFWYRVKTGRGVEDPKKRVVAVTLPTSAGFEQAVKWANDYVENQGKSAGFRVVYESTGSKNLGKHLVKGELFLGKEESGHEVHPESFDDALWQLFFVLNMMGDTGKTLDQLRIESYKEMGFEGWVYGRVNLNKTEYFETKFSQYLGEDLQTKRRKLDLQGDPLSVSREDVNAIKDVVNEIVTKIKESVPEEEVQTVYVVQENLEDQTVEAISLEDLETRVRQGEKIFLKIPDGVKIIFKSGIWGMIRISGTETPPVVRIYAEGSNEAEKNILRDSFRRVLFGDNAATIRDNSTIIEGGVEADFADLSVLKRNGGIDLNAANMAMSERGDRVAMRFDPAMIAQFKRGDFTGIRPEIVQITPVPSLATLMGLTGQRAGGG